MLNYIWGIMILIGIIVSVFNGTIPNVTETILESSKEAVNLCIVMLGIVGMWNGLMNIAKSSGLLNRLAQKLNPVIDFLYPNIPKEHSSREYISFNMIANMLGIGWAATPTGLKAMEELQKLNKNKSIASNEMCMFIVINISSLQLIPVNMIAYRTQYGSINPTSIIAPALISTTISTIVAVILGKILSRCRI